MAIHAMAGKPAPKELLIDVEKLQKEYYARKPDITDRAQRVSFGTSGHRGSSLRGAFNEAHVLAITQSICDYRKGQGIGGPLYIGKDTHALSDPAFVTSLEVLAANGVDVMIDRDGGYTPTPAVSHAILTYNRDRKAGLADGIVITPSHNPPEDGGFKYNPPHGGPADTDVTRWIEERANRLLEKDLQGVTRMAYEQAHRAPTTHAYDYVGSYVNDLARSWTWTRSESRAQDRRRSAGRSGGSLLGSDRRTVRAQLEVVNTRWTRPSASCPSTRTARSAWTARRPMPWRT